MTRHVRLTVEGLSRMTIPKIFSFLEDKNSSGVVWEFFVLIGFVLSRFGL